MDSVGCLNLRIFHFHSQSPPQWSVLVAANPFEITREAINESSEVCGNIKPGQTVKING